MSDNSNEGERGKGEVIVVSLLLLFVFLLLLLVFEDLLEVGGGAAKVLLGAVKILGTLEGFILEKTRKKRENFNLL